MHYITLDTNTWIYLANGTEPARLLHYINEEVDKGNIIILVPETILAEWDDHKDKTVRKGARKHVQEVHDSLEKIKKLFGAKQESDSLSFLLEENNDRPFFDDVIDSFQKKKNDIDNAVNSNIQLIENLLKQKSTVISAKDKIHVKCGQFALAKKAPFKNKNSYADALIIFTLLDYVKENAIKNAFFISYNTEDFCEKSNGEKTLHQDLISEFNDAVCQYYKTVGEALKTIKNDIVSKEELKLIRYWQEQPESDDDIEFCQLCCEDLERLSEVYYGAPKDLTDERGKENKIAAGECDWCSTLHFKCVDCGTVNIVRDEEYEKSKECEGCGLLYVIHRECEKGQIVSLEYTIPEVKISCARCGDNFAPEDMVENLCANCEQEYAYGEK
ncbi:protein of unknown function [Chitinophaga eiseniae]|uniref:DUF4935 domain-containing protein n=2 Tax=Chitinophaga eiseniae TaxID=634771 RepID=A0A1T4SXZ1_9BACT|nr:protein of unknown function [Chitinophaga eiseniae]